MCPSVFLDITFALISGSMWLVTSQKRQKTNVNLRLKCPLFLYALNEDWNMSDGSSAASRSLCVRISRWSIERELFIMGVQQLEYIFSIVRTNLGGHGDKRRNRVRRERVIRGIIVLGLVVEECGYYNFHSVSLICLVIAKCF